MEPADVVLLPVASLPEIALLAAPGSKASVFLTLSAFQVSPLYSGLPLPAGLAKAARVGVCTLTPHTVKPSTPLGTTWKLALLLSEMRYRVRFFAQLNTIMRKFDCEPVPVTPFCTILPRKARSHQLILRADDLESTKVPPLSHDTPSAACLPAAYEV